MTNISNQSMALYQEQNHKKKKLKDLNLMDAFLFDVFCVEFLLDEL